MPLPALDRSIFARRLRRAAPEALSERTVDALWAHYQTLMTWTSGLSLIGPGTEAEAVERHYGESLAVLPWIDRRRQGCLLDVGSGAGFPGFVLAAARPRLEVWLAESRQRKWAFLRAAAARAGLPCNCLNARVAAFLPPEIPEELEFVTLRAVKLPRAVLDALLERLVAGGAMFWWRGAEALQLPPGWQAARSVALPGSQSRRVVEVRRGS